MSNFTATYFFDNCGEPPREKHICANDPLAAQIQAESRAPHRATRYEVSARTVIASGSLSGQLGEGKCKTISFPQTQSQRLSGS